MQLGEEPRENNRKNWGVFAADAPQFLAAKGLQLMTSMGTLSVMWRVGVCGHIIGFDDVPSLRPMIGKFLGLNSIHQKWFTLPTPPWRFRRKRGRVPERI